MINLLPIENKKNVWRDYRRRRAIAVGVVFMFFLLTGIILLAAFYSASLLGWQPRAVANVEKDERDRIKYEKQLSDLKKNLDILAGQNDDFLVADLFDKVAQTIGPGVKIKTFRRETDIKTGLLTFNLQISAIDRKSALAYIEKLHRVSGIKDVAYPILTGDKNLIIPVELILDKNKK